ncbi:MAG: NAD(P)-dependent oxidoreductase [Alphaproteobacteria bacterium]|nr:NAD(P)-dependent oxidoreductase [Alphaproteobacteria bacterium]
MPQTLLVTGGGGFVLSHLVRQWLERATDNRAIVVDVAPLDAMARRWFWGLENRLTFVQGSVSDPALWAKLPQEKITHIVHAAAVTSINRLFEEDPAGGVPALETNMMGPARALAFATECSKLVRMVHVSTGSVYGKTGPDPDETYPLPEDGYIDPDGFYGITKFTGEQLAAQWARQFGLPVVAIRLSSVYGPMDRETLHRAVNLPPAVLMRLALAGKHARISNAGGAGDYIHAGDVARAILALFDTSHVSHLVYNVAYGQRLTMGQLVEAVAEVVPGFGADIVPVDRADIVVDPNKTGGRWNAYDISRLTADTGWKPVPLKTALCDYRDWLRAQ